MAKENDVIDIDKLRNIIQKDQVTNFISIPQLFQSILDTLHPDEAKSLKIVTLAGDSISKNIITKIKNLSNKLELVNEYGVTEVAVMSTINRSQEKNKVINIGRPVWNTKIEIVDNYGNIVPVGIWGEMQIISRGVADGYLNKPELTHSKFEVGSPEEGFRLYKTGDIARWLPDGNIEFSGRKDLQVKVRGLRIELNEIENNLLKHEQIEKAIVVTTNGLNEEKALCAYYKRYPRFKTELWPSVAEFFIYDELLYSAMINDTIRNNAYKKALKKVAKDKIVVEVGPGPEVLLSRFAIEAGAKKAYAIEIMEDTYNKAKKAIQKYGYEDRIILIHGDATKIELPEKADIHLSEIVGPIGGCEGSSVILNNTKHLLKEDASIIPFRSITKIAAVYLPEDISSSPRWSKVTATYCNNVFEHVGKEFDLRVCIKNFPKSNIISNNDIFEDLDYTKKIDENQEHEIRLVISKDSYLDGFLIWLNLQLDKKEDIDILKNEHCWLPVYVSAFCPKIRVKKGDYIQAKCLRKLSSNSINPDFKLIGEIISKNNDNIPFEVDLPHIVDTYKSNDFYKNLFENKPIDNQLSINQLRKYLGKYLPEFYIPQFFMEIEDVPLTPTGKIDKNALPKQELKADETYVAPSNEIEKKIVEIWAEVLHIDESIISINSNFFEVGGDSLSIIKMNRMITEELNTTISMANIFRLPTIKAITDFIRDGEKKQLQTEEQLNDAVDVRESTLSIIGDLD